MGQKEIEDHRITETSTTDLWNSLRDGIGTAIIEFKRRRCRQSITAIVRPVGRCVSGFEGRFIEIFISQSDQTVKLASGGITTVSSTEEGTPRDVARYDLNKDRTGLEFRHRSFTV